MAEFDFSTPTKAEFDFSTPTKAEFDFSTPTKAEFDFSTPTKAEFDFSTTAPSDIKSDTPEYSDNWMIRGPQKALRAGGNAAMQVMNSPVGQGFIDALGYGARLTGTGVAKLMTDAGVIKKEDLPQAPLPVPWEPWKQGGSYYSDVMGAVRKNIERESGEKLSFWPRIGLGMGGFIGDVALDPLTYVSLGGPTAGRAGARTATKQAGKKIAKKTAGLLDDVADSRVIKQILDEAALPEGVAARPYLGTPAEESALRQQAKLQGGVEGKPSLTDVLTKKTTGQRLRDGELRGVEVSAPLITDKYLPFLVPEKTQQKVFGKISDVGADIKHKTLANQTDNKILKTINSAVGKLEHGKDLIFDTTSRRYAKSRNIMQPTPESGNVYSTLGDVERRQAESLRSLRNTHDDFLADIKKGMDADELSGVNKIELLQKVYSIIEDPSAVVTPKLLSELPEGSRQAIGKFIRKREALGLASHTDMTNTTPGALRNLAEGHAQTLGEINNTPFTPTEIDAVVEDFIALGGPRKAESIKLDFNKAQHEIKRNRSELNALAQRLDDVREARKALPEDSPAFRGSVAEESALFDDIASKQKQMTDNMAKSKELADLRDGVKAATKTKLPIEITKSPIRDTGYTKYSAKLDGKEIGFVEVSPTGEVSGADVIKNFQRQGVGSSLYDAALTDIGTLRPGWPVSQDARKLWDKLRGDYPAAPGRGIARKEANSELKKLVSGTTTRRGALDIIDNFLGTKVPEKVKIIYSTKPVTLGKSDNWFYKLVDNPKLQSEITTKLGSYGDNIKSLLVDTEKNIPKMDNFVDNKRLFNMLTDGEYVPTKKYNDEIEKILGKRPYDETVESVSRNLSSLDKKNIIDTDTYGKVIGLSLKNTPTQKLALSKNWDITTKEIKNISELSELPVGVKLQVGSKKKPEISSGSLFLYNKSRDALSRAEELSLDQASEWLSRAKKHPSEALVWMPAKSKAEVSALIDRLKEVNQVSFVEKTIQAYMTGPWKAWIMQWTGPQVRNFNANITQLEAGGVETQSRRFKNAMARSRDLFARVEKFASGDEGALQVAGTPEKDLQLLYEAYGNNAINVGFLSPEELGRIDSMGKIPRLLLSKAPGVIGDVTAQGPINLVREAIEAAQKKVGFVNEVSKRAGKKGLKEVFKPDPDMITRLAGYIHLREGGMGGKEASRFIKKWLIDYADLTASQRFIRTFFPFATWLMKGVPRTFEGVLRKPASLTVLPKLAANSENWGKSGPNDRNKLSSNTQRGMGIRLPFDRGGDPNYPQYIRSTNYNSAGQVLELLAALNPKTGISDYRDGTDVLRNASSYVGEMLAPHFKSPLEVGGNVSLSRGRTISDYPADQDVLFRNIFGGLRAPSSTAHIIRSTVPPVQKLESASAHAFPYQYSKKETRPGGGAIAGVMALLGQTPSTESLDYNAKSRKLAVRSFMRTLQSNWREADNKGQVERANDIMKQIKALRIAIAKYGMEGIDTAPLSELEIRPR